MLSLSLETFSILCISKMPRGNGRLPGHHSQPSPLFWSVPVPLSAPSAVEARPSMHSQPNFAKSISNDLRPLTFQLQQQHFKTTLHLFISSSRDLQKVFILQYLYNHQSLKFKNLQSVINDPECVDSLPSTEVIEGFMIQKIFWKETHYYRSCSIPRQYYPQH